MNVNQTSSQLRTGILLLAILAYIGLYAFTRAIFHGGEGALAVIPVLVAGWYFGIRAGVSASLIASIANIALASGSNTAEMVAMLRDGGITGSIGILVIGFASGWAHDLNVRVVKELKERRIAEKALVESEERMRQLYDTMSEGMVIADPITDVLGVVVDWTFREANNAFEYITGISRQSVINQKASSICTDDGVLPAFLKLVNQMIKSSAPEQGEVYFKSVDKYFRAVVSPFGQGQIVIICTDITVSRRAEQAEREQRVLAEALRETASGLNSTLCFDAVLDRILDTIGHVVPYDAMNIMLVTDGTARIVRERGYQEHGPYNRSARLEFDLASTPNLKWMAETALPLSSSNTRVDPNWLTIPGSGWIRSYAGAPIFIKGVIEGFLNLDSATPDFYAPEHAQRLQVFADQAAVAIENARLFETTQQNAQRLSLLYEISVALNHSIELNEVFQAALDGLVKALGVDQAGIALLDDSRTYLTVVADHSASDSPSAVGVLLPLEGNESMQRVLETKRTLFISDTTSDPRIEPVRSVLLERKAQSILITPLLVQGEVAGTIGIDSLVGGRRYSADEINLVETIANLTAVRIEHSRLFQAERQRTAELALLHATLLDISTPHTMAELQATIVERAAWLVHSHGGRLFRCNPETEEVFCVVSKNPDTDGNGLVLKFGEGAAGWVARTGKPLIVDNYALWGGRINNLEAIDKPLAVLTVPMIWQGVVTGVIQLYRETGLPGYSDADQGLLSLFASQAVIAIENARLYGELQQQAITDPRTGLYNLRGLTMLGGHEVERALRYGRPLAVIMIDIDHFKRINDAYGHPTGDQVLVMLVENLRKMLRSIDIFARYGGEEFVVILPECDTQTAEGVAIRMRQAVEWMVVHTRKADLCITASFGIAEANERTQQLEELIINADAAMYKAKQAGRNCVRIYQPGDTGPLSLTIRADKIIPADKTVPLDHSNILRKSDAV